MVPVVRDVDRLDLFALATAIANLAARGRDGTLTAADLSEPAHDVVTVALAHMKTPGVWAIWAGLLLKIVEVDVCLSAELKRRVRALL